MRIGAIFDDARLLAESMGMTVTVLVERLLEEWVAEQRRPRG
jgi:hypothetical protein